MKAIQKMPHHADVRPGRIHLVPRVFFRLHLRFITCLNCTETDSSLINAAYFLRFSRWTDEQIAN